MTGQPFITAESVKMNHQLNWFEQQIQRLWAILRLAVKKFFRIDGAQWAGAFAFNAFFSLFPLIVLFFTIASAFIERETAGKAGALYGCVCSANDAEPVIATKRIVRYERYPC